MQKTVPYIAILSDQFNFKGGIMEGEFTSPEDASAISCYTLTLSGKQCKESCPKNAAMLYTGICGGCHGDDGKGLRGTYPDLTKNILLGIKKRESFFKSIIETTN